jgi:hypothetical protein
MAATAHILPTASSNISSVSNFNRSVELIMPIEGSVGGQLADAIVAQALSTVQPEAIADILERLAWTIEDSEGLLARADEWLTGGDKRKAVIRLCMQEFYPHGTPADMTAVLGIVTARWPELAEQCRTWVGNRRVEPT